MSPTILTDAQGLGDMIHDYWFDLEQLTHDRQAREVRLGLSYKRRGPYDETNLRITDVSEVEIHDDQKIQVYDLCGVDVRESSVHLIGCIPIEIVIHVGENCKIIVTHKANPQDAE